MLIARSRRTRIILWAALLCTHVAVAALAAMWWAQQGSRASQDQLARGGSSAVAAVAWSVVSVSTGGVLVRMGAEPQGADERSGKEIPPPRSAIAVPVGGRLPNGELLTLVDASRGMYVTPTTRTFVSPNPAVAQRP